MPYILFALLPSLLSTTSSTFQLCSHSLAAGSIRQRLNIPDIDLLQALYDRAHYEADLPYGRSACIHLMRGQKQGDKLSPLLFNLIFNSLFNLIFNSLILALRATCIGHRTVTGLRAPARGFADDLTLITSSEENMTRLLKVVEEFCGWSDADQAHKVRNHRF